MDKFLLAKEDLVKVDNFDELAIVEGGPYTGINPDEGTYQTYYRVRWSEPPLDLYQGGYLASTVLSVNQNYLTWIDDTQEPIPPEEWESLEFWDPEDWS